MWKLWINANKLISFRTAFKVQCERFLIKTQSLTLGCAKIFFTFALRAGIRGFLIGIFLLIFCTLLGHLMAQNKTEYTSIRNSAILSTGILYLSLQATHKVYATNMANWFTAMLIAINILAGQSEHDNQHSLSTLRNWGSKFGSQCQSQEIFCHIRHVAAI